MSVEERDKHSGYMTTGHEWNGIKELNTPVPRVVWFFLILTFAVSLVMWLLWPTWPGINTYTPGILGTDERASLHKELAEAGSFQTQWTDKILESDFDEALKNVDLMGFVNSSGQTLFADNCGACHGINAKGGPGYPNLLDNAWLWGGDGDAIMETLRVGINSQHEDTRIAQMPSFGLDETLDRKSVKDVVDYVQSINTNSDYAKQAGAGKENGAAIFAENCASCHGENAQGKTDLGAPNLTDQAWTYGGTRATLYTTIWRGRMGHMPNWDARLTEVQRKTLALYLLQQKATQ